MTQRRDRRPAANRAAEISVADQKITSIVPLVDDVVRCTRCMHVLTAEVSVRLEMGPVCRREVAA